MTRDERLKIAKAAFDDICQFITKTQNKYKIYCWVPEWIEVERERFDAQEIAEYEG